MDTFGIVGLTFGIIAMGLVTKLRNDFNALKKNLQDSGVLIEQTESEST